MRDKVALGNIGVPTPAYRVLGDPSPCRGFNVGPSHLALLTKLVFDSRKSKPIVSQ